MTITFATIILVELSIQVRLVEGVFNEKIPRNDITVDSLGFVCSSVSSVSRGASFIFNKLNALESRDPSNKVVGPISTLLGIEEALRVNFASSP